MNKSDELVTAVRELAFQYEEKQKLAAELIVANKELVVQNEDKEKRAAELVIANTELVFQNEEKGKRAAELVIANEELVFQNEEKEKRAAELILTNKELTAFNYVSSHDLQEPLRKILTFGSLIIAKESDSMSPKGREYLDRMLYAAERMQRLIEDLLAYSRINATERKFETTDLDKIIEEVKTDLKETIEEKQAVIEVTELCHVDVIPFQFHQLMYNLISNALKFSKPGIPPHIIINSRMVTRTLINSEHLVPGKEYCEITVKDDGVGFEPEFSERIFEVFQKLHSKEEYAGTGIGLAIVKKIVDNHKGIIIATGAVNKGARFDIYLPVEKEDQVRLSK